LFYLSLSDIYLDEAESASKVDDGEEQRGDDEDDVDELMGYHFLSCTTLFIAYVYVNSGFSQLIRYFSFFVNFAFFQLRKYLKIG
jgi:hypothetical protein